MLGWFKKKTELEKLQIKYNRLMKESYRLSTKNRQLSDKKVYEADLVAKEIEKIQNK